MAEIQNKQPDILLVRYSFVLQSDGKLISKIDSINPDEFLKVANDVNPEWEDAVPISTALKYIVQQLKILDEDFEKYLLSL